MNKKILLESILNKASDTILDINEVGVFQRKISQTVTQYKPHNGLLENILVYSDSDGRIKEISFYGRKFSFSLNELINQIKIEHSLNYSFRDNITKLTFDEQDESTYITSILDNKVEIHGELIKITNEIGETSIHDKNDEIINHLSVNFKVHREIK